MSSDEYLDSDVMNWQHMSPPYLWKEHGLTVVGDRHLPNGDRQHIVLGSMPLGTVIDNAYVFGQDDMPNAVYDDIR